LNSVQSPLRRYLCQVDGVNDADDVLQDVLVLIYRKLVWLNDPSLFIPWAFRITGRQAFRWLKRRQRWHEQTLSENALEIPASVSPQPPQVFGELQASVVSPASRAVLVLHFQHELPLAEVASILNVPLGTVKSRLAYGLAALRRHLAGKRGL
jgi:RNA polymerase sigma-70 factor (ECF subfamily)